MTAGNGRRRAKGGMNGDGLDRGLHGWSSFAKAREDWARMLFTEAGCILYPRNLSHGAWCMARRATPRARVIRGYGCLVSSDPGCDGYLGERMRDSETKKAQNCFRCGWRVRLGGGIAVDDEGLVCLSFMVQDRVRGYTESGQLVRECVNVAATNGANLRTGGADHCVCRL